MRADDRDKRHVIERAIYSAIGLALIALGAFVFIRVGEAAATYALVLTTTGGVLFDRKLVSPANIRRVLGK